MKKDFFYIGLILLILAGSTYLYLSYPREKTVEKTKTVVVTSFEECVAAGFPVQESYPRRCTADGKSFTEDLGNSVEKQNLIRLTSPKPNETVKSPLSISGQARGNWFFEASFPVKILDANGKVLGQGSAKTTSDWMTENFVPFTASLTFTASTTSTGKLVLEKDNPSGLAKNADQLEIPIKFK